MEAIVAPDGGWRGEGAAVEDELVALDEALAAGRNGARPLRIDRAAMVVDNLERLVDVQRPRFAGGVDAVPIKESERRVTGLLNLGDHQAGAEGMHRAGRDEDTIADAGFEGVKAFFDAAFAGR